MNIEPELCCNFFDVFGDASSVLRAALFNYLGF